MVFFLSLEDFHSPPSCLDLLQEPQDPEAELSVLQVTKVYQPSHCTTHCCICEAGKTVLGIRLQFDAYPLIGPDDSGESGWHKQDMTSQTSKKVKMVHNSGSKAD